MGSRTAISAGVLAVALAAVPVAAPAASAAAQDCTRDGGLLSGVTNALCDVVNAVTGTVDNLTGGTTDPVTKGVDKTTDEVLGRVGEAVPTDKDSPTQQADPSPRPTTGADGLVPETLRDVCLPAVLACDGREPAATDTLSPTPSAGHSRRPPREGRVEPSPPSATRTPARPESRPQLIETRQPVREKETASADEPRVDLLWPNPFAHELTVPMQDRRVVRPSPPASDVLGTALTIALLGSAVLATRIVQQRRHQAEPAESIPFEPARAGNGRHRLAS
ncbi:hypothetical protein ABGB18_18635 [Nonomuraea sp. B12E4]|uniref:hypothetical protein n=1 Tax=Nonomuraea sp. B12E4 TaxID=3153564 RepID=UPI00325C4950